MAAGDEPDNELHTIEINDPILGAVDQVVGPPVDAQLELLPTGEMRWEDFERLLLDLGKEELGLTSLSFYGSRGQAQDGPELILDKFG